ncbi:MAG: DUF192 domain-containing protein [Acidimicrobiales bacterium]
MTPTPPAPRARWRVRWLKRLAWLVLLLGLVALTVQGANRPPDPFLVSEHSSRRPLEGFEEVALRVTDGGGTVAEWCALLADDAESRSRGLMGQSDLRGYDGMVFRFPSEVEATFFMRDTQISLSIAFFDDRGAFVSQADMEPCPPRAATCPSYGAAAPYLHAVEVVQGGLAALGIGPGVVLSFPGGCAASA